MKLLKDNIVGLLLLVGSFVVVAALYGQMPQVVPIHWDAYGNPNGFASKPWGPFIGPLASLGTFVVLIVVRVVSPKNYSIDRFARTYGIVVSALMGFFFVITAITSLAAAGLGFNTATAVSIAAGVLFVVLGNYMGKLTRNFFVGIRTPWTLANEEVWGRTHRMGGKLFVASGLLTVIGAIFGHGVMVLFATVLTTAAVSVVYSYLVYRSVEGSSGE